MPLLNKFTNEGSLGVLTEVLFPKAVQFSKNDHTPIEWLVGLPDKCHTRTPVVHVASLVFRG